MVVLKTGPVRTSGYAIKLRRAFNAAFRKEYKEGKIDSKKANEFVTKLNQSIYEVLVNKFQVPKEAVVNITLEVEESEGELSLKDINVDVYDKDEILSSNATKAVKEKLGLTA